MWIGVKVETITIRSSVWNDTHADADAENAAEDAGVATGASTAAVVALHHGQSKSQG